MKRYSPSVPKAGDIVCVRFLDHTEGMDRPVMVEAFGRVHKITRRDLVIDGWHLPEESDVGNALTRWTLLRSTIQLCRTLVPASDISPV